ncbi:MAG: SDR family oxidoreductase [Bacteroidales bacterium]|jgi:short-subunit dehydrogenase|nr:SDR family oxidoreductase [Bacteroidales bacterium]
MSEFNGKKVLITGGASGIGKTMGRLALSRQAELVIWDIDQVKINATIAEFSTKGNVSAYCVDVSSPEQVKIFADKVKKEIGQIDILINNAGIVRGKFFNEHNHDDITKTMFVNTLAPMYITLEFLPEMIHRKSGHICNIASLAGLISNPKMSVYAASKWAVIGWSDSVRLEMKQLNTNIHVTTVNPYYINTGMFDGVKSRIPLLKTEKVAHAIIRAIEKDKTFLSMPWSMRFIRLCQGLFGVRGFDAIVGNMVGVYKTMEHFSGHNK